MINGSTDRCYICGDNDHFAKKCNQYNDNILEESSYEYIDVYCCSYCDKEFDTLKGATCHENLYCKQKNKPINKKPNYESSYEYIDVYCCSYCDKEFDTLKGATCHENLYCGQKNKPINKKPNKYFRCGREGHNSNNCYASKHINGKKLS
jgi:hypothetical protein